MHEVLAFMGEHPILTILIVWSVCSIPYKLISVTIKGCDCKKSKNKVD